MTSFPKFIKKLIGKAVEAVETKVADVVLKPLIDKVEANKERQRQRDLHAWYAAGHFDGEIELDRRIEEDRQRYLAEARRLDQENFAVDQAVAEFAQSMAAIKRETAPVPTSATVAILDEDDDLLDQAAEAQTAAPKPAKTWKSHRDFLEHGGSLVQQEDGNCAFGCGLPVPLDGGSVDLNDDRGLFPSCVHGVEAVRIVARDWRGTELTRPLFYYSEKIRLRRAEEEKAARQRIIQQEEDRAAAREEARRQQELEEKRLHEVEEAIIDRCFEHHAVGTPMAGSCEMPGCGEKFAPCRLYFAERVLWPDTGSVPVGRMHKLCQRHGHEARDVQHAKRAGIFWIFRDEQFATGYFKNRPIRFETRPTNGNGHNASYETLARVERSRKGKPKTSTPQKKTGKLSGLLSREWNNKADIDRANEMMRGAPPPPPPPKPNKKAKKGRKANGAQASA